MSHVTVSVIIPFYNSQATLTDTLKSVAAQTLIEWEALLINDGSTDKSSEIAKEVIWKDARFRLITTKNQGLSSARNTGIFESKGKYIQFLDSDDLIGVRKLEKQVHLAEKRSSCCITYSNCIYFLDYNNPFERPYEWKPFETLKAKTLFVDKNQIPVSAPLINAEFARKVGLFDKNLQCLEDWDYWIRCNFSNAKWEFLSEHDCDTRIRQRENSMSTNQDKMIINEIKVYRKYQKCNEFKNGLTRKIAFHRKALLACFLKGQFAACRKHLLYLWLANR